MQVLLNTKDAAAYARLPLNFFRLQVRHGNGPDFVQPSPKRKFFAPEALDRWIASWKTKEVQQKFGLALRSRKVTNAS